MFEIGIKASFSGAHHLRGYRGSCANRHGHNWEVEVFVRGRKTSKTGILVDFREVKEVVKDVLSGFDHRDLNESKVFAQNNPTSENIARYIYRALSSRLKTAQYAVSRVTVHETPGSSASYWE